jgi:hypothetical protein
MALSMAVDFLQKYHNFGEQIGLRHFPKLKMEEAKNFQFLITNNAVIRKT